MPKPNDSLAKLAQLCLNYFEQKFLIVSDEKDNKTDTPVLTQSKVADKIKNILKTVDLSAGYYGIAGELTDGELHSKKWKTYIYLRKCVLEYRNGDQQELLDLLSFLENKNNKTWLAKQLLDKSYKETKDEKWGSGQHEWLERCLIVDVLKRSAGMVPDVEAQTDLGCIWEDIDWLYVQAMLRSPTKYIFFKNADYAIEEGHCGAVKKTLKNTGFCSKGSPHFHEQLVQAFYDSKALSTFIKKVHNIFKTELISGKKKINASEQKRVLVDGTETKDEKAVNAFRKQRLRPQGYDSTNMTLSVLLDVTTKHGDIDVDDITLVDSDSDDDAQENEEFEEFEEKKAESKEHYPSPIRQSSLLQAPKPAESLVINIKQQEHKVKLAHV